MIENLKIQQADLEGVKITDMPDKPTYTGMTASQIKEWFDALPANFLALGRFNALIDALASNTGIGNSTGAKSIGATTGQGFASNTQDVLDNLYNQIVQAVPQAISGANGITNMVGTDSGREMRWASADQSTTVMAGVDSEKAYLRMETAQGDATSHKMISVNGDGVFVDNGDGIAKQVTGEPDVFQYNTINDFPPQGNANALYVDKSAKSIYYWGEESEQYEPTFSSGLAASIEVDSTETIPAGESAFVENLGTPASARLKFSIPKGDKGDKGETGDGDMLKAEYATNGSAGVVDKAANTELFNGKEDVLFLQQDAEYIDLSTTDKTTIGAINEVFDTSLLDRGQIIDGLSLDRYNTTPGFYYTYGGTIPEGFPLNGCVGILEVLHSNNGSIIVQRLTLSAPVKSSFTRTYYAGIWSNWVELGRGVTQYEPFTLFTGFSLQANYGQGCWINGNTVYGQLAVSHAGFNSGINVAALPASVPLPKQRVIATGKATKTGSSIPATVVIFETNGNIQFHDSALVGMTSAHVQFSYPIIT